MDANYLRTQFEAGLTYEGHVGTGTPDQQARWRQMGESARLTEAQRSFIAGWTREMRVLVVSGVWCGDCIQQIPLLARIAEANPEKILLRIVDRDQHRDLSQRLRVNGGDRVPVALFLAEDHELCSIFGDRTLNRYRALAHRQLGHSCPTGLVPPEADEVATTLQDWLDEFERIQLMLRLSGRLRQKHGD